MDFNWKEFKRGLIKVLLLLLILGSMVGIWFINKAGPWVDWKETWSPYLSWTDDPSTTITISFKTPENISTTIFYGLSRNYTNSTNTSNTQWHSVTLTNLEPSSLYFYRISSSDINYSYMNVDYHFTTAPAQNTSAFRFAVYGDHRPGHFGRGFHDVLINAMIDYHPDFVLDVGDVVLDASGNADGQWDRLFYEWRHLAPYTPIMVSMGNHEFYEGSGYLDYGAYYKQAFNFPGNELYYSFNYSNAHFISMNLSIDEHRVLPGSPEYNWLINDLNIANSSPLIDWIFVFFHVPLYSSGSHSSNDNLIADLQYIFENSGVDVVIQGHDHHYERILVNNLTYFIFGGGGAEQEFWLGTNPWSQHTEIGISFGIFEVDGLSLTVEGIRPDGYIFDRLTLTKIS